MKKTISLVFVIAVLSISCAHRKGEKHGKLNRGRTIASTSTVATAKASGVMEARVNWLKDKKNKFDFGLTLSSNTEKGLIVYLGDINCKKGNVGGEVKHTFFNTGERTIDFRPNQTKQFKLVCNLGTPVDSKNFKVTISRISENLNNDGKTAGRVLARNLSVPVTL